MYSKCCLENPVMIFSDIMDVLDVNNNDEDERQKMAKNITEKANKLKNKYQ